MRGGHTLTCAFLILALVFSCSESNDVKFTDTSISAGLIRTKGKRKKYGGASIADVDGDGFLDLLFCHHDDQFVELYYGNGKGKFSKSSFKFWTDTHGLNPMRFSAWQKQMHFLMSQGGNFGKNPSPQLFWRVNPDRSVTHVTEQSGLIVPNSLHGKGRTRSAVFMNLQQPGYIATYFPDAVFTNAIPDDDNPGKDVQTWAYRGGPGSKWIPKQLTGPMVYRGEEYATVTDVDNDGRVELVAWFFLRMFAVRTKAYQLDEITDQVFPKISYLGTIGVCEFDFNNDGKWDLYVARTNSGVLTWAPQSNNQDRLLLNVGGKYINIESTTGVPFQTQSRGCTAADFDNDGFVDIILPRYNEPDLFLRNVNGKKFEVSNAGFNRDPEIPGDMATAADLNNDGKVDVVLSEGDWFKKDKGGYYRIMMNTSPTLGNYLLVRVMSSTKYTAISLHAVVRVSAGNGKLKMMRRVGSPGTVVSNSYIETVHFGLGAYTKADSVSVTWTDGNTETKKNVPANSLIKIGI